MGRQLIQNNSENETDKDADAEVVEKRHPVDSSNFLSFATFSWMSPFMFKSYKKGLSLQSIPPLSHLERCDANTLQLEQLWAREQAFHPDAPELGRVLWLFCRRRIYLTTFVYLMSIFLGFLCPTFLMKRVLNFASDIEATKDDGALWITLLILCEFARVFFFTLTWAMSYRTAFRVKSACIGLVYRKIFRLGSVSDAASSKILNVISCDCSRIYDVILSGQMAIGGPVILILSVGYILYELGWFSLIGMAVFPLAYPLQYFLARGSGSFKKKAVDVKDSRVSLITQAIHNLKFIKMFGWEKYFHRAVSEARTKELGYLKSSLLLQSWSVVLGPTLPHIGAIITFILYLNSGNSLTPTQAFVIVALFIGRIRPTLARIRTGFRSYFDSKIAICRIKCFTILFVFSLLGYSVRATNQLAEIFYTTKISRERIEEVLRLPEMGDHTQENYGSNNAGLSEAIVIEDMTLVRRALAENSNKSKTKSKSRRGDGLSSVEKLLDGSTSSSDDGEGSVTFSLENINLTIRKGSFVGICGLVGSGKSTFMDAVSGSLEPYKGRINVMGKIAYVPQIPWIFKGTLRDNIVFGEPFHSVRYYKTIDACCLTNDFGIFPLGDLTPTDENGSNLSGGQKQRLSLARAVYSSSRDIYLLDNPFSGLDSRVAKTIFERCVKSQLLSALPKTILFVTHQLNFLKDCDEILVFSDGSLKERGTHDELMRMGGSQYASLVNSPNQGNNREQEDDILLEDDTSILECKMDMSLKKETPSDSLTSQGSIPFSIYNLYIQSSGGACAVFTVLLGFALSIGSTAFSSWWLKDWFRTPSFPPLVRNEGPLLSDNQTIEGDNVTGTTPRTPIEVINRDSLDFEFNRNIYAGIIGVIFLTSLFRTVLFVYTTMRASKILHRKLTTQFFSCTLKAANWIGFGQILNLFSRDIGEIDSSLPNILETFLQNVFIVASIFVLVSVIFPVFLGPLLILSVIFVWIRNVYNASVRDLKRFETDAKTPIFTRVTETITGLTTIRAYGKQRLLTESFDKLTDHYHSVYYTFVSSIRWLSIRLDCLAVAVTGLTALLILIFHGKVSAAAAGLALAYAAQLSGVFQFTVRLASETEAKFVSIERINKFLTTTQTENISLEEDEDEGKDKNLSDDEMIPTWPYGGAVKFDAVVLSYTSDALPALRDVSFEVTAGQKIGIVGRTGSGKSSIGNALFRLNELKSGSISIDGVNIKNIPLNKLRQSLCVIPQDPSIFQRSVRFNLDPGNLHTDLELWEVLKKTGLNSIVDNLDSDVGLSQGQKQLLSIARALLRDSKVVFVDEATSNIDVETGASIDRLLATEFHSSTVFIVAHRLAALAFCDWILVMEDGEVRDFGPVQVVSKKPEFLVNFEKFDTVPLSPF